MKSFLQGKNAVSVPALKPLAVARPKIPSCPNAAPANGTHHESAARVEVVKEGGAVVRLVLHCSCGERIEVECLY